MTRISVNKFENAKGETVYQAHFGACTPIHQQTTDESVALSYARAVFHQQQHAELVYWNGYTDTTTLIDKI